MPLAPGPFLQAPQSDVTFAKVDYGFTAEATSDLGGLDALGVEIDAEMATLVIFAGGVDDPLQDAGLDLAIQNFNALDPDAAITGLDGVSAASSGFETMLTGAIAAAPVAAWIPGSTQFIPPAPVNLHTPVIPASGYTVLTPVPGILINTGPSGPGVTLTNMTRLGQQNFWVGDQIMIQARGPVAAELTFTATQNGVDLGTIDFGTIPPSGLLVWDGTIDSTQIGAWTENWFIGGAPSTVLNFVVLSAS